MKGRPHVFSEEELSFIEFRQCMSRAALHAAFVAQFGRTEVSADSLKQLCLRKGWGTGRTGRFAKGMVPANKGKACEPGMGGLHPNARKTQFKAGRLPHNTRGPGHESIDDEGYVWLIVAETNPHTGADTRRVMKHRWLWEQANGLVPDGMVLKCLDGNKQHTDPANWEPIPRAMLPRLNGRFGRRYDEAPAELKPMILTVAKLEHAARSRREAGR